ncbi:MAG: glycosyltransferase family 9 protein, partial [Bacteroidota bacterium]
MHVKMMRKLDRFMGIPLCWATGLWTKVFQKKEVTKPVGEWKNVLVIKFFGMGSILLATPFLSRLKEQGCSIAFLTFETNREMAEKLPYPSHVFSISTSSAIGFVTDTMNALRAIRGLAIDAVFDLEFFSKFSTLVAWVSGSPIRVGYDLPVRWRSMNTTHHIPLDHSAHVRELFLHQLKVFGVDVSETPPVSRLMSSRSERISMERKLNLAFNGFRIVAVNTNAGPTSLERRWEPDRFMEVAAAILHRRRNVRFFFTGSADEHAYVEAALRHSPKVQSHAVNCAGLLTLGELIALLERSSLFLTNDSGPMHIASSVGTPMVALFGPESPQFYGPFGPSRVLYK